MPARRARAAAVLLCAAALAGCEASAEARRTTAMLDALEALRRGDGGQLSRAAADSDRLLAELRAEVAADPCRVAQTGSVRAIGEAGMIGELNRPELLQAAEVTRFVFAATTAGGRYSFLEIPKDSDWARARRAAEQEGCPEANPLAFFETVRLGIRGDAPREQALMAWRDALRARLGQGDYEQQVQASVEALKAQGVKADAALPLLLVLSPYDPDSNPHETSKDGLRPVQDQRWSDR